MAKKKKPTFEQWYSSIYTDRWPALREALTGETRQAAFSTGLIKPYFLDEASIYAAKALEVAPGQRVLDMCAAPGGKSLVLAVCLDGKGTLVSNDRSSARRARLHRVLDEHLPDRMRANVQITGHDATRWGLYEQNCYDRILLDAPCSSERHVLNSDPHLAKWSPARTKHLAQQAYSMLAAAYAAAKPGGMIVYSTCALSPLENDDVIARLLKKRNAEILSDQAPFGSPTEHGRLVAPDTDEGRGPLYFARIVKIDSGEERDVLHNSTQP